MLAFVPVLILGWAASSSCHAPADLDAYVAPGSIVLLGEIHGTAEAPAFAAEVACRAFANGRQVRIGLEIATEEQPRIDRFLQDGDVGALTAGAFWQRKLQDGRSSAAMVTLLLRARDLVGMGADLRVFAFDAAQPKRDRDGEMAARIARHARAEPAAAYIVLVGNLHAGVHAALPQSMAFDLQQSGLRTHSIDLAGGRGTAWTCGLNGRCAVAGAGVAGVVAGSVTRRGDGVFELTVGLPPLTASPPAIGSIDAGPEASTPAALQLEALGGGKTAVLASGTVHVVLPWSTLCAGPRLDVLRRAARVQRRYAKDRRVAVHVVNFDALAGPNDASILAGYVRRTAPRVDVLGDPRLTLIRRLDVAARAQHGSRPVAENALMLPDAAVVDGDGTPRALIDAAGEEEFDSKLAVAIGHALADP